jgi:hypothetical protein
MDCSAERRGLRSLILEMANLDPLWRLEEAFKQCRSISLRDRELFILAIDKVRDGWNIEAAFARAHIELRRTERNLILHRIANEFYPGQSGRPLARAIHNDWLIYGRHHYGSERLSASRSAKEQMFFELAQHSPVLSEEWIRDILTHDVD